MPIAVVCPGCNSRLNAPDAAAGKTVKCPKCKEAMIIPAPEADAGFEEVVEPEPPKRKVAAVSKPVVKTDVMLDDDEDEDEKPRAKKKSSRDDDDDEEEEDEERPRKKKGKKKPVKAGLSPVLIGAIAAGVLLLGGGGFAIYWFAIRDDKTKETVNNNTTPPNGPTPPMPGVPNGPNQPGLPGPGKGDGNPAPSVPSGPVKPLYETGLAPQRSLSTNNLRQIGLAMHNFADVNGALPGGIYQANGSIGLSWRVAILPFIEQETLFREFRLNEPWDSEHNKKLIPKMPQTYAAPGQQSSSGLTYYRSFTGPETVFPPGERGAPTRPAFGLKLSGVSDGLSNTGMVVEAGDAVEWTKPDELVFSPSGTPPRVGGIFADGYFLLLGDGSVRRMKSSTSAATLKAIITAKGGEIVDFEN